MTESLVTDLEHSIASRVDLAVLDDDPDFLQYMEDVLTDEGHYTVRCFTTPRAMCESFERRLPSILLLDMKMGEHQGDTVLQEVQSRWPQVCVIVVTGYPSLEDMRAKFQQKVFDYLAKPFSIDELRQALDKAIVTFGLGRSQQDLLRERLGPRIRMLRTERNWSLKEFAAATNISVSQLSSIERGAHLPSMESFLAICQALSQKPSDVFATIAF
ncbi:MAG: response regulator [Bryobacterales bacterium]|nr:response regulator [Bryobacterales bacterium]